MQRGEFEEKQKQIATKALDAVVATINTERAQVATRNEWDQFVEKQDGNDSDGTGSSDNDDNNGVALRTTALVALEGNKRATKKRLASNVNVNVNDDTNTNTNAKDMEQWTEFQVSKSARN